MNPYVTHPLVSSAEALLLIFVTSLAFRYFGIETIPAWLVAIVVPAIVVSAMYYGREGGQREHDIKNASLDRGAWAQVRAFFLAEFMFGWTRANVLQWLVAAFATAALAAALIVWHLLA